ncbi:MAG: hypothetical protein KF777_20025 [Planctomycetaceae bacterium]|nr:hypothetical protein [Planctomycetaceae bacterium]
MRVVVVSFDSLAASALGCHGNEWVESPTFDRLAARGVVFPRALSHREVISAANSQNRTRAIWENGLARGAKIRWLRDERAAAIPGGLEAMHGKGRVVSGGSGWDCSPQQVPEAELFRSAAELVADDWDLLWVASAGVQPPWQPPEGFATLYFEDFAERGFPVTESDRTDWGTHPAVYGGAVSLLDHWLGEFVAALERDAERRATLLIVTAWEGMAWQPILGQTAELPEWHAERLTVPLVVTAMGELSGWSPLASWRPPRPVRAVDEVCRLLEGASDPSAIAGWLERTWTSTGDAQPLLLQGENWDVVETDSWKGVFGNEGPSGTFAEQLFVRPDDRWEVNDVASIHHGVMQELQAVRARS